ncbi:MAG: hypothetical protein H6566_02070 [Lewinellaceae bacterium]|nr:hypothetical protein [Lewinellaceae bacterium]
MYASGRCPVIDISATATDDGYCFAVRDNGIGIDEHNLEVIFSLFHRLHPPQQYEGNGLGLTICRKIVGQHQGRIWVESDGPVADRPFSLRFPAGRKLMFFKSCFTFNLKIPLNSGSAENSFVLYGDPCRKRFFVMSC